MNNNYSYNARAALLESVTFLGPFIARGEDRINAGIDTTHARSPLFIIGPPRSGSTKLYQMSTHTLAYKYINNLTYNLVKYLPFDIRFHKISCKLHSYMLFNSSHVDAENYLSTSECPECWDRQYVTKNRYVNVGQSKSGNTASLEQDQTFITVIINAKLIKKFLCNFLCIRILRHHLANGIFSPIKRIQCSALRIFYSQEKMQKPLIVRWNDKAKNYHSLENILLLK